MSNNGKLVLGYCSAGTVETQFHQSVTNLLISDAKRKPGSRRICVPGGGTISSISSPRIASTRNKIVRLFLDTPEVFNADWLLMLDTDMVFEPDLIDKLLEAADPRKRPIVSGLCIAGGLSGMWPTIYMNTDPELVDKDHPPMVKILEYPENSVIKVDGTGAAALLMHRGALEKMREHYPEPAPWFMETIYKGHEIGEDITFCWRAASRDIPIHVHTGAKLGHVKPFVMDEDNWKAYHAFEVASEG